MDESAGNRYENLSIDIQLILYTEPVEYNHDHEIIMEEMMEVPL